MLFAVSTRDSENVHASDPLDLLELVERRMLELMDPNGHQKDGERTDAVGAAAYHLASGGQRVRARLALSSGKALGLSDGDAVCIASCAELLHNASLIHDDLEDGEQFRRGVETVCAAYGKHIAICTGDLMLSAAYAALSDFGTSRFVPVLMSLVHERTSAVINGQCAELIPTGRAAPDMALYERIAAEKSGSLLGLPIELALTGSSKSQWVNEARTAANHFAIGYQIADDIDDVAQDEGTRSVNAVLVLKASEQGDLCEALSRAREHGLRHLDQAILRGGSLPGGSGALLKELAQKLRDRI